MDAQAKYLERLRKRTERSKKAKGYRDYPIKIKVKKKRDPND